MNQFHAQKKECEEEIGKFINKHIIKANKYEYAYKK